MTTKAKPLEVGSMARMVAFCGRVGISSEMMRHGADRYSASFPPSFELAPPLCDLLRDLLAPAAEERADGDAKGGLVGKPGLKGRRAVPGFVARHLHARREVEALGTHRLVPF